MVKLRAQSKRKVSEDACNFRGRLGSVGHMVVHVLAKQGLCIKQIARLLKVTPRAVRYTLVRRNQCNQKRRRSTVEAKRIAARRARVQKMVVTPALPTVFPSCAYIGRVLRAHGVTRASTSTVRRDLLQLGFRARRRPRGPMIQIGDNEKRIAFCKNMLHALPPRILFSDEKVFDCNDHGNPWQWCRQSVAPQRRAVSRWAPKVHVWGIIGVGLKRVPPRECQFNCVH